MATKGTTLPAGHITEPSVQDDGHVTSHHHEADGHILHHHFDDMDQQREATTLGMWAFLVTEIMMFGGLFFVYTLYRWKFGDAFAQASHMLNWKWGAINTGVLLVSSLTMAMAVHAAAERKRKQLIGFIVVTMLLGATFLGIKAIEWTADYNEGLIPAIRWDPSHWPIDGNKHAGAGHGSDTHTDGRPGTDAHVTDGHKSPAATMPMGAVNSATTRETDVGKAEQAIDSGLDSQLMREPNSAHAPGGNVGTTGAHGAAGTTRIEGQYLVTPEGKRVSTQHIMMYFVVYFCMTGLHAIHMIIGLAILTVFVIMGSKGAFTNGNDQPVELVGLYWHLVDIIWVFLFPLLYLIGGIKLGGH